MGVSPPGELAARQSPYFGFLTSCTPGNRLEVRHYLDGALGLVIRNPAVVGKSAPSVLLRRGRILEAITLGWNVAGIVVLTIATIGARSVALAGFGLDSLIEIGASTVVLWELSGTGEDRQRRALRLIGGAFLALATYLAVQSGVVLATGSHPGQSPLGIAWTAVTAVVMFALAAGKERYGNPSQPTSQVSA
jgi:hypothetical protein